MKNLLLSIAIIVIAFNAKSQTKIYDFPFNGSNLATTGSGKFTDLKDYQVNRSGGLDSSGFLNNTSSIGTTLSTLPVGNDRRTVSLWFNRQGPNNKGIFAYGSNSYGSLFGVYINSTDDLVFQGFGTPYDTIIYKSTSSSMWYHVALMYTGTNVKAYVNGSLVSNFPRVLSTGIPFFQLGNMVASYDDLKIYNDTLTEVQLTELYTKNEVTSSATTSIKSTKIENKIVVYPNPAHDFISIENLTNRSILSILDLTGKIIYHTICLSNQTIVNTKDFANGTYLIRIEDKGSFTHEKFVINK